MEEDCFLWYFERTGSVSLRKRRSGKGSLERALAVSNDCHAKAVSCINQVETLPVAVIDKRRNSDFGIRISRTVRSSLGDRLDRKGRKRQWVVIAFGWENHVSLSGSSACQVDVQALGWTKRGVESSFASIDRHDGRLARDPVGRSAGREEHGADRCRDQNFFHETNSFHNVLSLL